VNIQVDPRAVRRWLFTIIGVLGVLHLGQLVLRIGFGRESIFGLARFVNLGEEFNLPSWYSALQLAGAALILTFVGRRKLAERAPHAIAWLLLAAGFWYLSLDESIRLHERVGPLLAGVVPREGIFFFRPLAFTIPIALLVPILFWRLLTSLSKETRNGMILGGALYVISAVGLEVAESYITFTKHMTPLIEGVFDLFEECGEMAGISVFIVTMLRSAAWSFSLAAAPSAEQTRSRAPNRSFAVDTR
jgi:hypothetical protein